MPNAVTLPSILIGLALWLASHGLRSFLTVVVIVLAVFGIGFLLQASGVLGGGDVKLVAAIGALMGGRFLGQSIIWALIVGVVVSFWILARDKALVPLLGRLYRTGRESLYQLAHEQQIVEGEGHRIPYALVISAGALLALALEWSGHELVG